MASSFTRFLDHTQRRITVGRTPLDEWSARRRDLYLTKHNTHNRQTSMPPVGFEPTISAAERPQTYALDRAAIGICQLCMYTQQTVSNLLFDQWRLFLFVCYIFILYRWCGWSNADVLSVNKSSPSSSTSPPPLLIKTDSGCAYIDNDLFRTPFAPVELRPSPWKSDEFRR